MSHSYDELIRQVASLKSENCKLRQELQDNSSHLTKLENEASNMKNALTQLHDSMHDDLDLGSEENRTLDHNSNDERHSDPGVVRVHTSAPSLIDNRMNVAAGQKSQNSSPTGTPSKRRSQDKEIYSFMDELNRERNSILWDIEQENKQRKRFFDQLDVLTNKLENLQLTDEMDMSRRQLEYETERLQERMKSELGAAEQIQRRHEARLKRIRAIEQEMIRLQQKQRDQEQSERNRHSSAGSSNERGTMSDACTETEPQLPSNQDFHTTSNTMPTLYHGAWPMENVPMRHSAPGPYQETSSVMSFNSSTGSLGSRGNKHGSHHYPQQQLGTKVEMVYSLLSMLGTHDKDDMSRTLLAMSSSQDSCIAMRQSGCLPLLIQLLHGNDKDSGLLGNTRGSKAARARAAAALHNIVHSHPDDKRGRREARVLRLLEQIRAHCDKLREPDSDEEENDVDGKRSRPGSATSKSGDIDHHPGPAIAALMKLSFDEEHRHAICTLGGLQAIAELLQVDTDSNGNTTEQYNVTMRRYACMALTNLTFGDGTNKALLCSMKQCLRAIVLQLLSPNEDLCQVAASVLRNLSWRADLASKKMLREVDTVSVLMEAALAVKKESTLKSILSALWNLSAHCSENKADICAVVGALAFLVSTLTYKSPSKTLAIIENGGGILRNVSSHIAIREDYRDVLRSHNCLQLLLKHLRSPSLTIVSNACGTLWNLSARCAEDQQALWELGAVSMLRNLVHSKHKMISMGSAAALKNLLAAKPNISLDDKQKVGMPMLHVRKQKALEAELDQNLSETCENLESPQPSPIETRKSEAPRYNYSSETSGVYAVGDTERHPRSMMRSLLYRHTMSGDSSPVMENKFRSPIRSVSRSGSQDSVGSVHSDISHDRSRVNSMLARSSKLLQSASFERRRDGSFTRYGDGVERKPSRIERIMQEVAMHAGIDSSSAFDSTGGEDNAKRSVGQENKNLSVEKYSNLHQKMESLNLNHESDEQPLNYSLKYASAENTMPASQNSNVSGENSRPVAKIGNYVGASVNGSSAFGMTPQGSPMIQRSFERKECNINGNSNVGGNPVKFSSYRETDIDTMDERPTNFSLQYSEADESSAAMEEPTNYSVRYREPASSCADCKVEGRHQHVQHSVNVNLYNDQNDFCGEDTMKTFCTEGTPLNFMSTATSISDLSAKPNGSDSRAEERLAQVNEDNHGDGADEVKDFSTCYSESERLSGCGSFQTGSTVVKTENNVEKQEKKPKKEVRLPVPTKQETAPVAPGPLHGYTDSSLSSPRDKPVVYGVEGTPTCFSRVSSLSSLHTNDAEEPSEARSQLVGPAASDTSNPSHEPYMSTITTGEKSPTADVGYDRDQKTVTFDEQVQETPLMFSRCSSLGSLASCEEHSIHSSIPSEYSTRRTSEVVSPSDLPDSPSQTMPPSPKRKEAPVKFEGGPLDSPLPPSSQAPEDKTLPINLSRAPVETNALSDLFRDTLVSYAFEGSQGSEVSSLSALTIDDEPKIKKDIGLKPQASAIKNQPNVSSSIIEENSSLSEGDEDMLIECINSGMPASSKKKMKRSQSDNVIKKKSSSSQSKLNQIARGSRASSRMNNKAGFGSAPTNFAPRPSGIVAPQSRLSMSKLPSHASSAPSRVAHLAHSPQSRTPPPPSHLQHMNHRSVSQPHATSSNLPRPSSTSKLSGTFAASQIRRPTSASKLRSHDDDYAQDSLKKYSTAETPFSQQQAIGQIGIKQGQDSQPPIQSARPAPRFNNLAKGLSSAVVPPQRAQRNVGRQPAHARPNFYSNDDYMPDTVKTFATEGTPLNFSTATSLSDLSAIVDDNKPELSGQLHSGGDGKPATTAPLATNNTKDNVASDTSSISDGEDLLSEVIQSAMPKKVVANKRQSADGSERKEAKPAPLSAVSPLDVKPSPATVVSAWKFQPQRTSSAKCPIINQDTVKTFMTEGTPINFSTATSLSDLTVDDMCDIGPKNGNAVLKVSGNPTALKQNDSFKEPLDDSVFIQSHSYDSPRVYAVEGTPYSVSRHDSLSSLSNDEEGGFEKVKPLVKKSTPSVELKTSATSSPKQLAAKKPENQTVAHLSGHNKKRTESQQQPANGNADYVEQKNLDDQPRNFAMEGTPMCFSRNSSLSSLNSDDHEAMATSNISNIERSQSDQKDQRAKFKEEGSPATFSRNSSLSSLSIISMESMSYDPSPTEQALLDQCISSAMPRKMITPKPAKSQLRKSASSERNRSSLLPKPQSPLAGQVVVKTEPKDSLQSRSSSAESASPKRLLNGVGKKSPSQLAKKGLTVKTERVCNSPSAISCVVAPAPSVAPDNQACPGANSDSSQMAMWRRTPHKSFDETKPKNDEGMGRFGWRRAYSQDSDAFVKQRKDSTNNAKVLEKLASPEDKLEWRKTYTVPKDEAFLSKNDLTDRPSSCAADNRQLRDLPHSPETREKGVVETDREKPPSPEEEGTSVVNTIEDGSRSETSEMSTDAESLLTVHEMVPRIVDDFELIESDSEVGDIMQETMPVLSGFTSMETSVASSLSRSMHSMTKSGELLEQSEKVDCIELDNGPKNPVKQQEGGEELDLDMSLEEVQALEEAANMVVRSIKRDMSNCTLDEDLFIDNETLSLVSTEYASDSCSEVSLTLSTSSKASEHQSEVSCTSNSARRGPRILKPGEKTTSEVRNQEETAKGIRGKRKALYSSRPANKPVVGKPKDTPTKETLAKASPRVAKARAPAQKTASPSPTAASKKPAVKPVSATAVVNPLKTPPKAAAKPAVKKQTEVKSVEKKQPPPLGSRSNTVIRRSPTEKPVVQPKPPTKQGTFVKDAPTSDNAPTIDLDLNGNRASQSTTKDQSKATGKFSASCSASKSSVEQRQDASKTWTKALSRYSFVVDTSSEDSAKLDQRGQQQKSASQIGSTGARRPGSGSPRSLSAAGSKQGSNSSLSKAGSKSNLSKTASGSSLNKCASKTPLSKVGSAGNLKKTGSRSSLKQSDSNASLKKSGSRSSTPSGRDTPPGEGRRSSAEGTPTKKTSTAGLVGKKQVGSKIAGLWKKDDGGSNASIKTSPQGASKKGPGSPNTPRRSSTSSTVGKTPRNSSPSTRPPPVPPVRKSSLSSNSSSSSVGGSGRSKSPPGADKNGQNSKPESLSRGRTFDKISRPATLTKTNSPNKSTGNSWRKEKPSASVKNQTKAQSDVWMKQDSSSDSLSKTANSTSVASTGSESSLSTKSLEGASNKPIEKVDVKTAESRSSTGKPHLGKTPPVVKTKPKPSAIPNGQVSNENNSCNPPKTVRSPPLSPTHQSRKVQSTDNRSTSEPLSAIVQPFNYNPNQGKTPDVALKNAVNAGTQLESPKPMTKTEMLLARRKQASKKTDELPGDDEEAKKAGCLVTTV